MNKFYFVSLFIFVAVLDILLLPAFFGAEESLIVTVFVLAMVLNWGVTSKTLWIGTVISFLFEFFWLLKPGSLVIVFLSFASAFFIVSHIFSVKRNIGAVITGAGLWLVLGYNNFTVLAAALAGFYFLFFLFDKIDGLNKRYV